MKSPPRKHIALALGLLTVMPVHALAQPSSEIWSQYNPSDTLVTVDFRESYLCSMRLARGSAGVLSLVRSGSNPPVTSEKILFIKPGFSGLRPDRRDGYATVYARFEGYETVLGLASRPYDFGSAGKGFIYAPSDEFLARLQSGGKLALFTSRRQLLGEFDLRAAGSAIPQLDQCAGKGSLAEASAGVSPGGAGIKGPRMTFAELQRKSGVSDDAGGAISISDILLSYERDPSGIDRFDPSALWITGEIFKVYSSEEHGFAEIVAGKSNDAVMDVVLSFQGDLAKKIPDFRGLPFRAKCSSAGAGDQGEIVLSQCNELYFWGAVGGTSSEPSLDLALAINSYSMFTPTEAMADTVGEGLQSFCLQRAYSTMDMVKCNSDEITRVLQSVTAVPFNLPTNHRRELVSLNTAWQDKTREKCRDEAVAIYANGSMGGIHASSCMADEARKRAAWSYSILRQFLLGDDSRANSDLSGEQHTVLAFLETIYNAYSFAGGSRSGAGQFVGREDRFFDPPLAQRLRRNHRAAESSNTILDIPGVGWDPFCQCQDSEPFSARISDVVITGDRARATVEFRHFQQVRQSIDLVRTSAGWRVYDIGGSYRNGILQ